MSAPGDVAQLAGPALSFAFNLAKIPDHGEDSDPILRDGPDLGLAGVFDGMGGAGGTVYDTDDGSRSGAYLASRLARDVVEEHLLARLAPDRPLPGAATAEALHDALEVALQNALTGLNAPVSRLRSRLLRALPTTMALGVLQRAGDTVDTGEDDGTRWICHVLWAGDSRVYALTAAGLQQLSIDDLRDPGDALENLQRDSVISNAIAADTDFVINHRRVDLTAPFALICATDGCFGYVRSPMHFEELVLRTLATAATDGDWSASLQAEIAAVTGDDASMAVIGVGADPAGLQRVLAARTAEMSELCTGPLDAMAERVAAAEQALADLQQQRTDDLHARWARYRVGYEALLAPTRDPEVTETPGPPERRIWNPAKPIAAGGPPAVPDAGGADEAAR